MRRALLMLAVAGGALLLAGCGGGDGDADAEGTIQQLKIAYTAGPRASTADTWSLRGGLDAASRSRVFEDGEVASDISLSDGFLEVWTPEAGQVIESPAQSAVSPDPFTAAEGLVAQGDLTAAGTVRRDGRELEVFAGSPEYFLLAGQPGTIEPADAEARYLRDAATGQPVELRIPAVRVRGEDVPPQRYPVQRYVVTGAREYPATDEAMEVFDLKTAYDAAGTGTTTVP